MSLHREHAPRERMRRRDDHHLGRQRSAQLTQSVWILVIWRKVSGGTQTEEGERFAERMLSVRETCRLQERSLHGYLVDVHEARLSGAPVPSPLAAAA